MDYEIIASEGFYNPSSYYLTFYVKVVNSIYKYHEELDIYELERTTKSPATMSVTAFLFDTEMFLKLYQVMIEDDVEYIDYDMIEAMEEDNERD